jgi:hypothetical protein
MFKHTLSYFLFGIGIAGLLFSVIRTYYLLWKSKKERDDRVRFKAGSSIDSSVKED